MELHPYQHEALAALDRAFQEKKTRVLVAMPTGTGKTVVFVRAIDKLWLLGGGKTLILVHREELIQQTVEKLKTWYPEASVSIERAESRADLKADVIVASVQTLVRAKRRARFDWSKFSLCIVDEAHHAIADSYKDVLSAAGFLSGDTDKFLIGFTATPTRGDKRGLEEVFEEIVFEYALERAIKDGFLCKLRAVRATTGVDIGKVKVTAGDFNAAALAENVNVHSRNVLIVKQWKQHASDRRTIAFCVDIKHAQDLAEAFSASGVVAAAVWGADEERAEKLLKHKRGEIQVLCNCGVLTEGYDDPMVNCVLLARPTKSGLLYRQMVGRGTRRGKPDCLILDIVDIARRHHLCEAADLAGKPPTDFAGDDIFKPKRESGGKEKTGAVIHRNKTEEFDLFDTQYRQRSEKQARYIYWATGGKWYKPEQLSFEAAHKWIAEHKREARKQCRKAAQSSQWTLQTAG